MSRQGISALSLCVGQLAPGFVGDLGPLQLPAPVHRERIRQVHEAPRTGGIAGEIAARVNEFCFEWLDAPVRRVTAPDTPVPLSPPLEDYYLVQAEDVVKASRWMLEY